MWEQAKALLLGLLQVIHNGITSIGIGTNFAWGLAIIALTLLVRLLMHPLTAKQMSSMQKMQKLQPQLQVLQEKYADDKDRLNQETMALYKDNKVNPASGCLPLIIQLPIFILLYGVLYDLTKTEAFTDVTFLGVNLGGSVLTTVANALNLVDEAGVRIPDEQLGFVMVFLSSFTNLGLLFSHLGTWIFNFILLVLIAYLTWLQQHLTSAGNSQMAMMNWFMPLFLTFICFGLPGGVLLYWGVSSLMGIVHQLKVSKKTSEEMSVKPTLYKEKPKTK
ncbi:MAG: YidC/Oxa1 family membrane protein insertase [Synergistaceae bacterium]|nr:YidC/Oxa1 family membrane protein insertase [Synergistaceae bacterium]MBQ3345770.1 YidC/Oxa1 family membrane protein insertase [Synergistaceae bacterium]MBQ3399292.1 YidC/Oxa1 family membrane protein insertase [Synergistaceae bacterium]MBQ3758565.1 YidC/Oxa1 family membrane protein insertase [Synergistaceae bacterium]MBQ4402366.1 YidC/Oxa1 family membrane protein insertase [Synergistaceae bacterium]